MNDLVINKVNGGLGRRNPSGDMISGLVANGMSVVGGVQKDVVYRLKGLKDAIALGINAQYDEDNSILVYEHIKEFFRINPNGDLYIMVISQDVKYDDILDPANQYAKKLLVSAEGQIKQLAVAYNPEVATDFDDTLSAIFKAQELADEEYAQHRPVHILLEGKYFNISSPVDFRDLKSKSVSVMVGQSLEVANREVFTAQPYLGYAAIGTLLGAVSLAAVNECVAWVAKFNAYGGSLLAAAIDNVSINEISEGLKTTLNDQGAIFFRSHAGRAGLYFNDSHTCTALTDDFAYIENNRTIDKAVRSIRSVILPRLNAPVLVDPESGQLSPEVIKSYENDGYRALEELQKNNEVSAFDVFVDPEQNILATSELQVQFELVPTGTARKITATIGFSNPF